MRKQKSFYRTEQFRLLSPLNLARGKKKLFFSLAPAKRAWDQLMLKGILMAKGKSFMACIPPQLWRADNIFSRAMPSTVQLYIPL